MNVWSISYTSLKMSKMKRRPQNCYVKFLMPLPTQKIVENEAHKNRVKLFIDFFRLSANRSWLYLVWLKLYLTMKIEEKQQFEEAKINFHPSILITPIIPSVFGFKYSDFSSLQSLMYWNIPSPPFTAHNTCRLNLTSQGIVKFETYSNNIEPCQKQP